MTTATATPTAADLFRAAYENRYTWDQNFPGYWADVTLEEGGNIYQGRVRIGADLKFQVLNVKDEVAQRVINGQVWEITIHRVRHAFEETHGQNTFSLGETDDTGAIEILVGGAGHGNRYKVRDNAVCFVQRRIRDVMVNINTTGIEQTPAGYLATEYVSCYFDPETGLPKGSETRSVDRFVQVAGYYLLASRRIETMVDGKPKVTVLTFSNFALG